MTDVLIKRELLEQIDETAICDGTDATISDDLFTQLVAALAAPRQPEGEGLEEAFEEYARPLGFDLTVPKVGDYSNHMTLLAWEGFKAGAADARRAIAELREECERVRQANIYGAAWVGSARLEINTLRQQLADSDAALRESRANDQASMGHLADMRQQRDKLAGLLRDALKLGELDRVLSLRARVLAALAEVNK